MFAHGVLVSLLTTMRVYPADGDIQLQGLFAVGYFAGDAGAPSPAAHLAALLCCDPLCVSLVWHVQRCVKRCTQTARTIARCWP